MRVFLPFFWGRNPSKQKRSFGKADVTTAGTNAVGPGRVTTSIPCLAHSLTSINPGSLIAGVPASEISAKLAPFLIFSTTLRVVWCSLNLWCDIISLWMSKCFKSTLEVRVSSARIRSTCCKVFKALKVISSRLPTGVGTTNNFPGMTSIKQI